MFRGFEDLAEHQLVLDLGSSSGSFPSGLTKAKVVRLDIDPPQSQPGGTVVQANAAMLPFRDRTFDVIIANHSLEHFVALIPALDEIGRVVKPGGALLVTVPDAATLSDRLYRWLGRGGGHVNPFIHERQLAELLTAHTGLRVTATVLLHSSFSFMNRKNLKTRGPRRLWLLGGGMQGALRVFTYCCRWSDRLMNTRLSVYGWAYFCGNCAPLETPPRTNVCIRCGSGHSARRIREGRLARGPFGLPQYPCPACATMNLFTPDES